MDLATYSSRPTNHDFNIASKIPSALEAVRAEIKRRAEEFDGLPMELAASEPAKVSPDDNPFLAYRNESAGEDNVPPDERHFEPDLHESDATQSYPWLSLTTVEALQHFLDSSPGFFKEPEGWEPQEVRDQWHTELMLFLSWMQGGVPNEPSVEMVDLYERWSDALTTPNVRFR